MTSLGMINSYHTEDRVLKLLSYNRLIKSREILIILLVNQAIFSTSNLKKYSLRSRHKNQISNSNVPH